MALETIIRLTPAYLSPRPVDAILVAWISNEDIQAVRAGEVETLMINGKRINLDPTVHFWPTQMVFNMAQAGKRRRDAMVKDLLSL